MEADRIDSGRVFRHYVVIGHDLVIGDSHQLNLPTFLPLFFLWTIVLVSKL